MNNINNLQKEISIFIEEVSKKKLHLEVQDNNFYDEEPLLSNIIVIPDEICLNLLHKLDPDLDFSFFEAADSFDYSYINDSRMKPCDSGNVEFDIDYYEGDHKTKEYLKSIFASLSDLALELRDKYVAENYESLSYPNNRYDANSVDNEIKRRG